MANPNQLQAVKASTQPSYEELKAKIAEYEARLAAKANQTLTIKLNEIGTLNKDGEPNKGTISVYGLQRFPLSLHPEQWERLLTPANVTEILALCKHPKAGRKADKAKAAQQAAASTTDVAPTAATVAA